MGGDIKNTIKKSKLEKLHSKNMELSSMFGTLQVYSEGYIAGVRAAIEDAAWYGSAELRIIYIDPEDGSMDNHNVYAPTAT